MHLSAIAIGLASLQTASAVSIPEVRSVNEVFPGPTLPSLESLGWNMTYINSLPDPVLHQSGMKVTTSVKLPLVFLKLHRQ
jgi:hypothetical protein